MNKLPNFMVIGAGKSGTTALYQYLREHPEVYMSPVKETNYFALMNQPLTADPDPEQLFHYPWSVTRWDEYQHLFEPVAHEKAIGEISPMYLYDPVAASRILDQFPKMKVIAILRQPVDRLYSRFMHLVREGREPSADWKEVRDQESIWWRRNDLLPEGFYYRHLKKYYELFPSEQIKIFLYEELKNNPEKVIREIYQFIGVDFSFKPNLTDQYNVSGAIRNKFIDSLIGQKSVIKRGISAVHPKWGQVILKNNYLKKWITSIRRVNLKKQPLSSELRSLIQPLYAHDINNLQSLINRDLTDWLTPTQS